MPNNPVQSSSEMRLVKDRLEKALDRLENAVNNKGLMDEDDDVKNEKLLTARREITELKKKNKIAASKLEVTIDQIKKILGS